MTVRQPCAALSWAIQHLRGSVAVGYRCAVTSWQCLSWCGAPSWWSRDSQPFWTQPWGLGVPLTPSPSWLRVFTSGTGRFPASQPSCLAAQPFCPGLCRSSGVACGLYGLRPGRLAGCWLIAHLRCRVNHARPGSHGQHACCFQLCALAVALAIWQRPRRLSAIAGCLRRLSAAMLTSRRPGDGLLRCPGWGVRRVAPAAWGPDGPSEPWDQADRRVTIRQGWSRRQKSLPPGSESGIC